MRRCALPPTFAAGHGNHSAASASASPPPFPPWPTPQPTALLLSRGPAFWACAPPPRSSPCPPLLNACPFPGSRHRPTSARDAQNDPAPAPTAALCRLGRAPWRCEPALLAPDPRCPPRGAASSLGPSWRGRSRALGLPRPWI